MAFSHGSKAKSYLDGLNLSPFLKGMSWQRETDPPDTTALGDEAHEYIPGLENASASGEGMFDQALAEFTEDRLNASSVLSYYPAGDTLGAQGNGAAGIPTQLTVDTPVDGVSMLNLDAQASNGAELLRSVAPLTERTGTANTAKLDNAAATTDGWAAYLHVTAVETGKTVTVKLQDSADDSLYVDVATFTAVGPTGGAQRKSGAGTLARYVRTNHVVTDGKKATFQVGVCRTPHL